MHIFYLSCLAIFKIYKKQAKWGFRCVDRPVMTAYITFASGPRRLHQWPQLCRFFGSVTLCAPPARQRSVLYNVYGISL